MRQLQSAIVAISWLAAAVCAQGGSCLAAAASPDSEPHSIIMSTGPWAYGHIVRNANQCAPDQAKAVWGPDSSLLGYACYNNPNGS